MSGKDQKVVTIPEEEQAARTEERERRAALLKQRFIEAGATRIEINPVLSSLAIRLENSDPILRNQATVLLIDDIAHFLDIQAPLVDGQSPSTHVIHELLGTYGKPPNETHRATVFSRSADLIVRLYNPVSSFDKQRKEEHDRIRQENTGILFEYALQFGEVAIDSTQRDMIVELAPTAEPVGL